MNTNLLMKINLIKEQIKDMDDKNQIIMIGESYKKSDWWLSILLTGLWQMCNGSAGFGICLLLFGWILLLCGGWIWGVVNAYNSCKEFNQHIDMIVRNRLNELKKESEIGGI